MPIFTVQQLVLFCYVPQCTSIRRQKHLLSAIYSMQYVANQTAVVIDECQTSCYNPLTYLCKSKVFFTKRTTHENEK